MPVLIVLAGELDNLEELARKVRFAYEGHPLVDEEVVLLCERVLDLITSTRRGKQ